MALQRVGRIGDRGFGILGNPLVGSGRAFGQHPLVFEEILEVEIAPLGRRLGPGDLEAAGDRVASLAAAEVTDPSEALLLDAGRLGLGPDMTGGACSVALAESVAAGDQGDGLLVIHRHPGESLADIARCGQGVGVAVGSLGIHIDEAHLHGGERVLQLAVTAVALIGEPLLLGTPIDLLRLPDVLAATGETEGLEPHRLEGDIPREDHQVGPGEFPAVLLLDRPDQAARLVEIHVVGPAVKRSEALATVAPTSTPVAGAVGAGAVPRHADKERAVVTEIRGPPLLRIRHQRAEVFFDGLKVEALELLGVIEVLLHRVESRGVLVEKLEVELVGPPCGVHRSSCDGLFAGGARKGAH